MKITFIDAVRLGLQKYFVFRGTATRPEFWYFVLFTLLVSIVLSTVDSILWPQPAITEGVPLEEQLATQLNSRSPLNEIGQLLLLIPSLSVTARRLHDAGFSGKWLLLFLLPIAYAIFAGFGVAAMVLANGPENIDLTLVLFLVLPILALSFAIFIALVIMNAMPTRSFYNGNKYAEPTPIDPSKEAGEN